MIIFLSKSEITLDFITCICYNVDRLEDQHRAYISVGSQKWNKPEKTSGSFPALVHADHNCTRKIYGGI